MMKSAAQLFREGQAAGRKMMRSGFAGPNGELSAMRRTRADDLGGDDDADILDDDGSDDDTETLVASFSPGHFSRPSKNGGVNVYKRGSK